MFTIVAARDEISIRISASIYGPEGKIWDGIRPFSGRIRLDERSIVSKECSLCNRTCIYASTIPIPRELVGLPVWKAVAFLKLAGKVVPADNPHDREPDIEFTLSQFEGHFGSLSEQDYDYVMKRLVEKS